MRATTRHYLTRGAAAVALLAALALGIKGVRDHERAHDLSQRAIETEPENLRGLLPEIAEQFDRIRPDLERVEGDASAPVRHRAQRRLLLHRERPTSERAAALRARLVEASPDEVALIRDTLATDPATARSDLLFEHPRATTRPRTRYRLRVACALAGLRLWKTRSGQPSRSALVRGLLQVRTAARTAVAGDCSARCTP